MIDKEKQLQIEQMWRERAAHQGYKPLSAKYMQAQADFFAGVMAGLGTQPPLWVLSIMGGRDIVMERALLEAKNKVDTVSIATMRKVEP